MLNTIFVNRADMFGLAQLYQLRGRVGRSGDQAYAYFLVSDEGRLSEDAGSASSLFSNLPNWAPASASPRADMEIVAPATFSGNNIWTYRCHRARSVHADG